MQQDLIDAVTDGMQETAGLRGLFLSGSFGSGTADAYSDVDFLAVAEPADRKAIADRWVQVIEAVSPVIFQQRFGPNAELVNLVTESWLRADLSQADEGRLKGQGAKALRPLFDPESLHGALDDAPVYNAQPLFRVAEEFIRVLGLLQVAMGRKEYVNAITGIFHMRNQLITLLIRQTNDGPTGGALHLNKLLTPTQLQLLAGIDIPEPEPIAIIEANLGLARIFLPLARQMIGADYPTRFEAATLDRLTERVDRRFADLKP